MRRRTGFIEPTELKQSSKSSRYAKQVKEFDFPETFERYITPEVFEQGNFGSCTSNAIITAYASIKKKIPKI